MMDEIIDSGEMITAQKKKGRIKGRRNRKNRRIQVLIKREIRMAKQI